MRRQKDFPIGSPLSPVLANIFIENFENTAITTSLTRVKDSIPEYKADQLVYKLSSQDCTTVYIGETSRSVADRMKEHLRLTKRHPKNNEERTKRERSSAIALHALKTEHHVDNR